jgi:3-deoxy-D-manno-octulosonate 8-phosphate phosphatase (KDO 8-P phosphatase)
MNPTDYSDCELTLALRQRAEARAQSPLRSKAEKVRLLLLDVDGVLTDGCIIYHQDGSESKSFHTQDGFGLRLLKEAGFSLGLITARTSAVVERRAKELHFDHLIMGCSNKLQAYQEILSQTGLHPEELAYMGDDWLDLPVLLHVGCSFAPANATYEVQQRVDYVTEGRGGQGAVREVCMLLLEARGVLAKLLKQHLAGK